MVEAMSSSREDVLLKRRKRFISTQTVQQIWCDCYNYCCHSWREQGQSFRKSEAITKRELVARISRAAWIHFWWCRVDNGWRNCIIISKARCLDYNYCAIFWGAMYQSHISSKTSQKRIRSSLILPATQIVVQICRFDKFQKPNALVSLVESEDEKNWGKTVMKVKRKTTVVVHYTRM